MFKNHLLLRFHLLCPLIWYLSLVGVRVRSSIGVVKFEVNRSYFLRCGKIFISVFEILLQKWRSYDVD